jgi:hypothetical protein
MRAELVASNWEGGVVIAFASALLRDCKYVPNSPKRVMMVSANNVPETVASCSTVSFSVLRVLVISAFSAVSFPERVAFPRPSNVADGVPSGVSMRKC